MDLQAAVKKAALDNDMVEMPTRNSLGWRIRDKDGVIVEMGFATKEEAEAASKRLKQETGLDYEVSEWGMVGFRRQDASAAECKELMEMISGLFSKHE